MRLNNPHQWNDSSRDNWLSLNSIQCGKDRRTFVDNLLLNELVEKQSIRMPSQLAIRERNKTCRFLRKYLLSQWQWEHLSVQWRLNHSLASRRKVSNIIREVGIPAIWTIKGCFLMQITLIRITLLVLSFFNECPTLKEKESSMFTLIFSRISLYWRSVVHHIVSIRQRERFR